MKNYIGVILGAAILGGISSLWIFFQAQAQTSDQGGGRSDNFTFFIPYQADILDDQFETALSDNTPPPRPPSLINNPIVVLISIAVDREGSIIFYDHWEDGLEANLTQPTQTSTEVWGDNDPANGIPPGFTRDLLASAAFPNDDVITLRNRVDLPRDKSVLRYDGGDVLTSEGGAVALSLSFWTDKPGPETLFTDAWELYPTNRWGRLYRIPIGENLAGTGPNQRPSFEVVGLNVQTAEDNTLVQLDLDANGSFEQQRILNEGEQWSILGSEVGIDPLKSVMVGATVKASAPVQVHVVAANPASRYEMRGYTMVPRDQLTNDYLGPRSADGDFWLYNPDGIALAVRVETSITAPTTIIIPPNSTIKYPSRTDYPPLGLSPATGIRFTALDQREFYALAAMDESDVQDWGYALLPFNRLATQSLVGLGLGNVNLPPDGDQSQIYVTAAKDTTIFVDFDNDGFDPAVDKSFPVKALQEQAITDSDHNLTGAFLFTDDNTPFATVWGQEPNADPALPSIDAGTGIVPLPSLLLQKTFRVNDDIDCNGTVNTGDILQFKLQYFNQTVRPIGNVVLVDPLPTSLSYIPNSTILNGAPFPDNPSGTPFVLDEVGYSVGEISALGTGVFTFQAAVTADNIDIINRANIRSDLLTLADSVAIFTSRQARPPLYRISQTLTDPPDGIASKGKNITFNVTITNTSGVTITRFPLQYTYNPTYLTFRNASPDVDQVNSGQLNWTDLVTVVRNWGPGVTATVTINFRVRNDLPPSVNQISSETVGSGGELSDGTVLPNCRARALVGTKPGGVPTVTPTLTPTFTPTPKTPDNPPPPPPATSIPPSANSVPQPTSTVFPVTFLPETGIREIHPKDRFQNSLLILALAGIGLASLLYWSKRRS